MHAPPAALQFQRSVVLAGEVHDNVHQHAMRLQAFKNWLATGARPALVMEQFDRDRQDRLDKLRSQSPPPNADALIAAAGGPGWQWSFYRPFVALALQFDLPIVAANVSRDEARKVMREGLAATGFNATVPDDVLNTLARDIESSHCGTLNTDSARRMALAQVARDQSMARAVEAHASRGVLLLAGNGHIRIDAGVPVWLSQVTRARAEAIGMLEESMDTPGRFDRMIITAAQPRPDPCEGLRR